MAFELCEQVKVVRKAKPMAFTDKPVLAVSSRNNWNCWKLKLNTNFNLVIFNAIIFSFIILALDPVPIDGKVLTSQKYYVHKRQETEESRNLQVFEEYYEDSFEDAYKHNFVEDYETDGGEVRFITEDDVEEERFKDEEFPARGARIVHLDPRCPDLPQPSKLVKNLCKARTCLTDDDCNQNFNSKSTFATVCCFNGCVHSCLARVDPPKAFDWLEDTEIRSSQGTNGTIENNASTLNPKALLTDEVSAGKISLPGGCYITQEQLDELRLFRKYDHVEVCTCLNGEVVCQINPKVAKKADELRGSKLPI